MPKKWVVKTALCAYQAHLPHPEPDAAFADPAADSPLARWDHSETLGWEPGELDHKLTALPQCRHSGCTSRIETVWASLESDSRSLWGPTAP